MLPVAPFKLKHFLSFPRKLKRLSCAINQLDCSDSHSLSFLLFTTFLFVYTTLFSTTPYIFLLTLKGPFSSIDHKILPLEQHNIIILSFSLPLHSLSLKLVVFVVYNCLPITILKIRDNLLICISKRTAKQLYISIAYWKYNWRSPKNIWSIFCSIDCQMLLPLTSKKLQ